MVAFPAAPLACTGPAHDPDRRSAPRYVCPPDTGCWIQLSPSATPTRGGVSTISARGAGLLMKDAPEPDRFLLVDFVRAGGERGPSVTARVIHVRALPVSGYLVGCAFLTPLTDEQVLALARPWAGGPGG